MTQAQINDLLNLTVGERLNLIETLWDSVARSVDSTSRIPQWHRDELEHRLAGQAQPCRAWGDIEKDLRAHLK